MSKLDQLNAQIGDLQLERQNWLNDHFMEFAEFAFGDRIYAKVAANDYKLQLAGIVTKIYCKHDRDSERPQVFYKFNRDTTYLYSDDTEGSYAYFYNHDFWVREKRLEIERLQRSL